MIEQSARNLFDEFLQTTKPFWSQFPLLGLDLTWPSVNVIDLMSRRLRGDKSSYTSGEELLIAHIASYLGMLAHYSWESFPEASEMKLRLYTESNNEVKLSVKGGKLLKTHQEFSIPITSFVRKTLVENGQPLHFFSDYRKSIPQNRSLLQPASLSLVLGPCPVGHGPWASVSIDRIDPFLNRGLPFLATSCSAWYTRCFPSEKLGRDPRLYATQVLFPPCGFRENTPGLRAAESLTNFISSFSDNQASTNALLKNLLNSPDESSSLAALIVCLATRIHPEQSRLHINRHAHWLPGLRWSVAALRHSLDLGFDWLTSLEQGEKEKALAEAIFEQKAGLLPSIPLPIEHLMVPEWAPFLRLILTGDTDSALEVSEDLLNTESTLSKGDNLQPSEYLLRLLRVCLELQRQSPERAEAELSKVAWLAFSTNPLRAYYFFFLARIALANSHLENAQNILLQAYDTPDIPSLLAPQILLELSKLESLHNNLDQAIVFATKAAQLDPLDLQIQIALIDNLFWSSRVENARKQLQNLASFVSVDPQVFSRLFA